MKSAVVSRRIVRYSSERASGAMWADRLSRMTWTPSGASGLEPNLPAYWIAAPERTHIRPELQGLSAIRIDGSALVAGLE
jgi:hypothetical protein